MNASRYIPLPAHIPNENYAVLGGLLGGVVLFLLYTAVLWWMHTVRARLTASSAEEEDGIEKRQARDSDGRPRDQNDRVSGYFAASYTDANAVVDRSEQEGEAHEKKGERSPHARGGRTEPEQPVHWRLGPASADEQAAVTTPDPYSVRQLQQQQHPRGCTAAWRQQDNDGGGAVGESGDREKRSIRVLGETLRAPAGRAAAPAPDVHSESSIQVDVDAEGQEGGEEDDEAAAPPPPSPPPAAVLRSPQPQQQQRQHTGSRFRRAVPMSTTSAEAVGGNNNEGSVTEDGVPHRYTRGVGTAVVAATAAASPPPIPPPR